MSDFLDVLAFSFSVTGPIFLILALGVWLMRIGMVTDAFVEAGSRVVFTFGLPSLLFLSVGRTHIGDSANFTMVAFGVIGTVLTWLLLEWIAARTITPAADRGVVVQGAFRSNLGIIGLAYCVNAYGPAGVSAASLYVGLVTIVYNVLAVITLSRSLHRSSSPLRILKGIATNPLIIGIVLALPVSIFSIPLPSLVQQSGQYLADLTLPLALLCTGASLDFRSLRNALGNTLVAVVGKQVIIPLLFTAGGYALGFRGVDLGVLMLLASAPTAAASYVMVRAMGGNSALAANIIALTTLASLLSTSIGITLLRAMQLI